MSVACDYPAHNYTYTFEPKPDWPSVYASGSQIRGYFEGFQSKYGLGKYCKTKHQVTFAEWKEGQGEWHVQVRDLTTGRTSNDTCQILINAAGVLNEAQWPDIPGLHDFHGQLIHSAKWGQDVDLKGKRVGLIGNGYGWFHRTLWASGKTLKRTVGRQGSRFSKPYSHSSGI